MNDLPKGLLMAKHTGSHSKGLFIQSTNTNAALPLHCASKAICMNPVERLPRTRLEIGSCGKSLRIVPGAKFLGDGRRNRRFLVKQSLLLFSCNTTQVTRTTRQTFHSCDDCHSPVNRVVYEQ